jgi:AcrR family transcriptional regulator
MHLMKDEVKPPKRRYNSTRRRQQAGETRGQILESARRLFLARGYSGTTIEAIAAEAGVAIETVYAAFRNKRTILARLFDVSVVGDDQPVPLLQRRGPQAVQQEHDQRQQITLFAAGIREIMGRVGALFEVMRLAAATEAEIAALLADLLEHRLTGMRFFVEALARNGPLRGTLTVPEAIDVVWTLTSAEVHRLLTVDRGWSSERYEEWLADNLVALLLPEARDAAAPESANAT